MTGPLNKGLVSKERFVFFGIAREKAFASQDPVDCYAEKEKNKNYCASPGNQSKSVEREVKYCSQEFRKPAEL